MRAVLTATRPTVLVGFMLAVWLALTVAKGEPPDGPNPPKAVDPKPADTVEVRFFNYRDGKTVFVTYDTVKNVVVKSEAVAAAPCPLTVAEQKAARAIADTDALVAKNLKDRKGETLDVSYGAPVVSDPKDPLYGKRIVTVSYWWSSTDANGSAHYGVRPWVDLTGKCLVKDDLPKTPAPKKVSPP